MGLSVKHGKIARVKKLEVSRDLSGGVKVALGGRACVLSPQEAVRFAHGVLQAAGVNVEFKNRAEALAS